MRRSQAIRYLLLPLMVLAVAFPVLSVQGFQTTRNHNENVHRTRTERVQKSQHSRTTSLSSAASSSSSSSSLSGLVGGMLKAQAEISKEKQELQQLQDDDGDKGMPILGQDGIYKILNEEQFHNFKAAHADKLVILKFSSPVCQACRMLKEKFRSLIKSGDTRFAGQPLVFADILVSNDKRYQDPFRDYVTSKLNVQRIPSIQLLSADTLVDTIGCAPEGCSWTNLKQQMVAFVEEFAPTLLAPTAVVVTAPEGESSSLLPHTSDEIRSAKNKQETPTRVQSLQNRVFGLFSRSQK
jgi:hypothetical protein